MKTQSPSGSRGRAGVRISNLPPWLSLLCMVIYIKEEPAMQISVSSTLTVYHDGQFWVGLAEHVEDGRYGVARIVFGAEPSDAQGALARSRLGRHAKRKPPNQKVRRPLFPLFRWWLCSMAAPKQHQAVLGGTKTRAQKPVTVIPTLSRSYAEVSFQLTSVWSSASTVLPPNPAACLRIGVWDKP